MAALGTRSLTLLVGGDSVTAQISNCRLVSGEADADFVSFEDAAAGGARTYRLQGTATQDMETGSLWDIMWTSAGTSIAAVLSPNGGTTASATQPKFSGNVIVTEPDGDMLGGEANTSATAKFTWEFDWEFEAKPVRAIA